MELIGDLERVFATSLYPLRVPIAIGVALALTGLFLVARRRGWFAVARRHPRRSGSVVGLALILGLPIMWYLASPLFIRSTLIEPAPVAVAALPSTQFAPTVLAVGSFRGADEFHFGQGTASIVETAPGRFTLRFDDFSVRNGPDLYVYLSPTAEGYADGAVELGALKATDGAFGYELPDGMDPFSFASAVIWCKQFAVQFAVAPFEAA